MAPVPSVFCLKQESSPRVLSVKIVDTSMYVTSAFAILLLLTRTSVSYELTAEFIIAILSAYSIRDKNWKIPIDCGKCHVKHDVTILLI